MILNFKCIVLHDYLELGAQRIPRSDFVLILLFLYFWSLVVHRDFSIIMKMWLRVRTGDRTRHRTGLTGDRTGHRIGRVSV